MVSSSLALHPGLVRLHGDRVQLALEPGLSSGTSSPPGPGGGAGSGEEALLERAVVLLSCASYRNQCLHVFLRPALLALAVRAAASNQKRELAPLLPRHATACWSWRPFN